MTNLEAAKLIDHLGIKQVYDDTVSATEICLSLDKGWCSTSMDFGEALTLALSALENIDRITAERDAAIADLRKLSVRPGYIQCDCCLHFQKTDGIKHCLKKPDFSGKCWEWRGVKHEQRKKEKE